MMYSSLRSTTAAASLRLLVLQLPLPVEHARLGALRLGLGHHAGRLVEARQAGVGEDVVRRELAELLPRLDRLLVPPELVVRHGEPVPGVDVAGIEGERLPVPGDRLLELAVAEEIDGRVVEVLLRRHGGSVPHSHRREQGAAGAVAPIAPRAWRFHPPGNRAAPVTGASESRSGAAAVLMPRCWIDAPVNIVDIAHMPAQPVQVSIEKALLKRIDTDPETKKRGRSAFIRSAVELYLKVKERREIDRAIRRAYSGKSEELLAEIQDLIEVQEWP